MYHGQVHRKVASNMQGNLLNVDFLFFFLLFPGIELERGNPGGEERQAGGQLCKRACQEQRTINEERIMVRST